MNFRDFHVHMLLYSAHQSKININGLELCDYESGLEGTGLT